MNGDDSGDENSLKGFYAYKNTFDEDTIWMDIPRNGMLLCEMLICSPLIYASHLHQHHKSISGSVHAGL
jgi:hypothetical protein